MFFNYLETISSLGRKYGLYLLIISIFFLLIGYIIGGILIECNRKSGNSLFYIQPEYIYSIVYGALFYTALVTLVRYFYLKENYRCPILEFFF